MDATSRPDGDVERVRVLAREHLGGSLGQVLPLAGGAFSRAYAVTVDERAYVVRISGFEHAAEAFAKDAYAWRHFASPALPIPRVVAVGSCAEGYFAISERVAGRRLAEESAPTQLALLPTALDTFDAIARVDVSATRGYGGWNADGQGEHARWFDFLADVIENRTEGFYQDWHALFRTSFLEREVYERIYQRMLELAADCPEERALIHNDYHFDNVLSDGERITGVIDWGNACYGDPLYDVAWVSWVFAKDYGMDAASLLRERHGTAPRYDERIACYTLLIGLDDMRYFARTDQRQKYEQTRKRLLDLIVADSGRG